MFNQNLTIQLYEITCHGTLNIQEMYLLKYRALTSSASKAFNTIQGERRLEVCWSNKSLLSCSELRGVLKSGNATTCEPKFWN